VNPLGIHALVWAGGWTEEDCRAAVESTKNAGYDFIEVPLLDPSTVDVEMTRKQLESAELKASCSLGLSFETDISSEDTDVSARGERLLTDAVRATAGIGASFLGGVLYSAMDKYHAPASKASRERCVEVLTRVAGVAAEEGVILGIEPVNRYESNICNSARQALEMIDAIGADNVAVHLDCYHMNIEEGDLETPVLQAAERLGYIHVGESHRGYLGSGTIDFRTFFRSLARVRYEGPIAFESFSSAVISDEFCAALAVWRDLWTDNRELAVHARRFMEEQLGAAKRAV
jgi:D-psicose/D-tagatose/L-ribulose 3-epimerase